MFEFLKLNKNRMLLINFDGLTVYMREAGRLAQVASFSDADSGREEFRDYLASQSPVPVTLLLDSVAEEFVVENSVHVNLFDRKQFLARKAQQHFRGAEYRSAIIVGREGSGRRDDKVLFSAITKSQAIEPWIKVLLDEEISIKGITTPAYVLTKIVKDFALLTSDTILLVNWEISGIRQSLMIGDKMMFSRLTPLPNDPDTDLAVAIIDSCNQSRDYLERVGLLDFDQKLDVHIITPTLDDAAFEDIPASSEFSKIVHHNSIEMMGIDNFSGAPDTITANLLCLDRGVRKGAFANIYAPAAALRFHQLRQARKLVIALMLAVLVAGASISTPIILDVLDRSSRIAQLSRDVVPMQRQYDALRAQFPETPIPSEAMELAVSNYELIQTQSPSPTLLLAGIAQVIAIQPAMELSSVEWSLAPLVEGISFTEAMLNEQLEINVEIHGVLIGTTNIQESDRSLRQFIDDLGQIEGVTVSPIVMPIETRPDAEVSTIISDEVVDVEFAVNVRKET